MQAKNIAMLGSGFIGDFYTACLHQGRNPDRVKTVYSRTEVNAKKFAEIYGIPSWTADLATVISGDVMLADACATALGNLIEEGTESAMVGALDRICSIDGVEGALVIVGEKAAMKGKLPEFERMVVGSEQASRVELLP